MNIDDAPSIDSMFRVQALLYLRDNVDKGISGYDLILEIERITGDKPSAGKLYPFLKQLSESNFLEEAQDENTGRNKTLYRLTLKGISLVDDLLTRMRNLIDARTSLLLEVCHHCGAMLYDAQVREIDDEGKELKYCCIHCKNAEKSHSMH